MPAKMSATTLHPPRLAAGPWSSAVAACVAVAALVIALLYSTARDIVGHWAGGSAYQYGLLVIPLFGVMIWRDRQRLAVLQPEAWLMPAAAGATSCLVWIAGRAAGVALIEQFAFVSILIALAAAVFGKRIFSQLAFPLAFLYFMVPFGESLIAPLQQLTASMIVSALSAAGLFVSIDGVLITTPSGRFNVAEACAGLRFLIAATMVAAFFAHYAFNTWRKRLLFIAAAGVAAIMANGIRASMMVLIATLTNMKWGVGDNHLFLGWISYAVAFAVMIAVGQKFADKPMRTLNGKPNSAARRKYDLVKLTPFVAVIVATSLFTAMVIDRSVARTAPTTLSLVNAPGWRILPPATDWPETMGAADRTAHATYSKAGTNIYLTIGYYAYDRRGAEIVNFANQAHDGIDWRRLKTVKQPAYLFGRAEETKFDLMMSQEGKRLTAVTAYWVDGRVYLDPRRVKLSQLRSKLRGQNPEGGVIMIAAPYTDDPQTAIDAIRAFTVDAEPFAAWLARLDAQTAR